MKYKEMIERTKDHVGMILEDQLKRVERIKHEKEFINFSGIPKIKIGFIGGDGIGPYITKDSKRVLKVLLANELEAGKVEFRDIHALTIEKRVEVNKPIPNEVLDEIKECHVTLKGPTTTPREGDPWPNIESANVALRKELDLFANIGRSGCQKKTLTGHFSGKIQKEHMLLGVVESMLLKIWR